MGFVSSLTQRGHRGETREFQNGFSPKAEPLEGQIIGSISGVSGVSNAWVQVSTQHSQMQAQVFTQVDTDTLSESRDGNSDSSLSSDELSAEVESLMTASTSTLDFADQRSEQSDAVDETDMQTLTTKMMYEQASPNQSTTSGNTLSATA
jgi:hypothetical protein